VSSRILELIEKFPGDSPITDPREFQALVLDRKVIEVPITRSEINQLIQKLNITLNRMNAFALSSIPGADLDTPIDLNTNAGAPGTATSVTAVAGDSHIMLRWTNPANDFLDVMEIWRHTANDSSAASLVGEVRGRAFCDGGLADATAYYYWLKARGFNGTNGAFHAGAASGATATTD